MEKNLRQNFCSRAINAKLLERILANSKTISCVALTKVSQAVIQFDAIGLRQNS